MEYNMIAIEREYASGGNEIGERASGQLGIPCYGQEVLERAARMMGTEPRHLLHLEETASNSYLYSIGMAAKVLTGERDELTEESAMFITEERVIRDIARQGSCVIVGRCAGWILRERKDVLRVFVRADREFRRKRAVEQYGVPEKNVESMLKRYDRRRSNLYHAMTGRSWADMSGYHIVLDSSAVGIEECVRMICTLAQRT